MGASRNRYDRQILVRPIGEEGNERIRSGVAVVIGLGALGGAAVTYLARAGVGTLRLVDRDVVDLSNLHRQVLYDEEDVRELRPKAVAAEQRLRAINSDVKYESLVTDLNPQNAEQLVSGATVVVDGLDNLYARAVLNQACMKLGVPWIHGGCVSTYGMTMSIVPGQTACYECLFPGIAGAPRADTADTIGVYGPIAGVIGALEAAEALKVLSGHPEAVSRQIRYIDVWRNTIDLVDVKPDLGCSVCGAHEYPLLTEPSEHLMTIPFGRNGIQVVPRAGAAFDFASVSANLSKMAQTRLTSHVLEMSLGEMRLVLFKDGRAMITGTTDAEKAKELYSRFVGI